MGQRIRAFIKRQWIALWIIVVLSMIMTLFVSAEYLDQHGIMNRVVVSSSEQYSMFSSNILKPNGSASEIYTQYATKLTEVQINAGMNYDIALYLWNYDHLNPSTWYRENIHYDMSFKLVKKDGTAITAEELGAQTITILKGEIEILTLNSSCLEVTGYSDILTYNSSKISENSYTIRFPGNWNFESGENICVQITATPNNQGNNDLYRDLYELGAIIGLRQFQSMGTSGWEVYVNEHRNNNSAAPSDFDAYNLVVAGSGKADIILYIDTHYISVNRYFYDPELTFLQFTDGEVTYNKPDSNGIAKLVIKADSSMNRNTDADSAENPEYRNRYDIQLYKKTGDPSSWSFVSSFSSESMPEGVWMTYQINNAEN